MMKKIHLMLVLFVTMALLTTVDYFITSPAGFQTRAHDSSELPLEAFTSDLSHFELPSESMPADPGLTQLVLRSSSMLSAYQESQRFRSQDLFERFDLTSFQNLIIYKSVLQQSVGSSAIQVYELYSPHGQTNSNYLSLTLQLEAQLNADESLNKTNDYGQSSFFFNSTSDQNSGFLVTQVGNMVFGFRYNKTSSIDFEAVKNYISTYQSLINS